MNKSISKELEFLKTLGSNGEIESANELANKLAQSSLKPAAKSFLEAICTRYSLNISNLDERPLYEENKKVEVNFSELNSLSELDVHPTYNGISIVSCCMNRNENLKKALKTWLKLSVDEIVIVDWSSTPSVAETLTEIDDSRIKIIRVENEPKWILTYGFNVGLRAASYSKIYKLDADIEVTSDFLLKNGFSEYEFIRGHWKSALDNGQDDQVYVNGSFGCHKKHLAEIGYYNEFIRTYGWDDSDLYLRLANEGGLKTKYLSFDSIIHMEQKESDRIINQNVLDSYFLGQIPPTEFNNQKNKYLVRLLDCWAKWHLQNYSILECKGRTLSVKRFSPDFPIPDYVSDDASYYAAILLIGWKHPEIFTKSSQPKLVAKEILLSYYEGENFNEISSALGLSGEYVVGFSQNENLVNLFSPCLASILKKNNILIYCRSQKISLAQRHEFELLGNTIVVKTLPADRFDELYSLSSELIEFVDVDHKRTEVLESKVNVTSIYDEKEPHRFEEYLNCIESNVKVFDALVLFYEERDGSFKRGIENKLSENLLANNNCQIFYVNIKERPTFRFLFDYVDKFFSGSQVFVSNADIAFDDTAAKISGQHLENNFLVLSRKETVPGTLKEDGYIMSQFGLPNTFSADVWIYQSPLKYDFRADFGIGTFHCDSFLNYHISNSGYSLFNPCLDVNNFHIHDEKFNSSQEKEVTQAKQIQEVLFREIELCEGEFPLKGVQWSRLDDTTKIQRANQLVDWSDVVVNIDIKNDGSNLVSALIQSLMALRINSCITGGNSVWLRIPEDEVNSSIADILFSFKELIGHNDLLIGVSNKDKNELFSNEIEGYEKVNIDSEILIRNYHAAIQQTSQSVYSSKNVAFVDLPSFGVHKKAHLMCNIANDVNDLDIYALLKSLAKEEKEYLSCALSKLCESEYLKLKPFAEDLACIIDEDTNFKVVDIIYGANKREFDDSPSMSFVTSIFKGDEFFKGFLENTAAALLECNGEMILVDAASPGDEFTIYNDFIKQYPSIENRILYIKLTEDPGLYNCWTLGIQKAKADWVGNANLDDRRSPFQARRMLGELKRHKKYKGAAAAIRATTARNTAWYHLTTNEYWFNNGFDKTITFEQLHSKDGKGLVKSQNIMHCMPIWHKSLHDKYGYFNEEKYGTSADWAFWLECTKNGEVFCLVPHVLSQYYINEQSHNRINDPNGIKENKIIEDYLGITQSTFIQQ